MNNLLHPDKERIPATMRRFLAIGWTVILAKCAFVAWAIPHWNVPVEPAIIIGPTLLMAVVATWLWLVHAESGE
jgi:hypothetical protein